MLVSVGIVNGGLLGERRDQTASSLVQNTYGTADKRTKASKYLIDRKHKSVKQVVAASQRVRETVYRLTMPWGEDKQRLLPVKLAEEFRSKIELALAELEEARAEYIQNYPALVAASERDLGELFERGQYPNVDKIRALFTHKIAYWPMPESNHFIADISNEAAKEAKEGIEAEIEQRLLEATYDMVRRAKEVVSAFVDKLSQFKGEPTGYWDPHKGDIYKAENSFRDSLVDNISDTANLIDRMNLTENPQIKKVVKDLRRLTSVSADKLRNPHPIYDTTREKYLTAGQEVLINLTMLDLKDQEISDMVADTSDFMEI